MKISQLDIEGMFILESNKFEDERGFFQETYHIDKFLENNINLAFLQDNLVYSKKNVLRGLHLQKGFEGQGKLVSCIKGKIFDVAVDLRKESETYKKWVAYFLSEEDNKFIYIPEGFAHGYSVESEEALVSYKCTQVYTPDNEVGLIWNDSDININWPRRDYILSDKDKKNGSFEELNL